MLTFRRERRSPAVWRAAMVFSLRTDARVTRSCSFNGIRHWRRSSFMFPRETGHNNISSSCDRGRPQCRVISCSSCCVVPLITITPPPPPPVVIRVVAPQKFRPSRGNTVVMWRNNVVWRTDVVVPVVQPLQSLRRFRFYLFIYFILLFPSGKTHTRHPLTRRHTYTVPQ